MSKTIRVHSDGKTLVPDEPVDLPLGEPLEVNVRLLRGCRRPRAARRSAADRKSITSLPFFGMWADREDMRDSVAWVRKERERWSERLSRQD